MIYREFIQPYRPYPVLSTLPYLIDLTSLYPLEWHLHSQKQKRSRRPLLLCPPLPRPARLNQHQQNIDVRWVNPADAARLT